MYESNKTLKLSRLNFESLYDLYATDIIRVAYVYLRDIQKAEDICHDTFVKVINNPKTLINGKEKTFLLTVAVNLCRDYLRSSWFKKTTFDDDIISQTVSNNDFTSAEDMDVINAISKLSAKFKEPILLHYYQGYGLSEIAEILNISLGTVSSRLARARTKLAELLKVDENEIK